MFIFYFIFSISKNRISRPKPYDKRHRIIAVSYSLEKVMLQIRFERPNLFTLYNVVLCSVLCTRVRHILCTSIR